MLEYKGLKGVYERLAVSDSQVDRQVDALLEQNTRAIPVTDRPSREGDELLLDYAGFCDSVQFEGGTAQNQTLVLGSGTFIPGFEAQLVGTLPGDSVDVKVTFPTPYHSEALAGKEAVFKCTIHEIRLRQKYAPDDTFAREVCGFDSFEALHQALRNGLQAYLDRQADEDLKLRLLDQLAEGRDSDIDQARLDEAVEAELGSLKAQLARQGLTLEAYCRFTGKTEAQLREECVPDAKKRVARQEVLNQIIEAEGIVADEDSVAAAIQQICRENNMTLEQLTPHLDEKAEHAIVQNVLTQKALNVLRDNAIIETVERQG